MNKISSQGPVTTPKQETTRPDKAALRARIEAERGYWSAFHEGLWQLDCRSLERLYLTLVSSPDRTNRLSPKDRQLIYVGVDSAVNHLHQGALRHIRMAMEAGASAQEVFEVLELGLELISLGASVAFPILADELSKAGVMSPAAAAGHSGVETQWLAHADLLAPDFAAAYRQITATRPGAALGPRRRALVQVAIYSSPLLAQPQGIRSHIREALAAGAEAEEISEAIQLAAHIAMHTLTYTVPVLAELARAAEG